MAKRLIDANALKFAAVEVLTDVKTIIGTHATLFDSVINTVCMVVDNEPTVDPVNHGKWICQDAGYTRFMCSCCESKNHWGHEKYCPDCGARMDGDVHE